MANTETTRMEKARRAARIARLIERLQQLDDGTVEALDRISAEALAGAEIAAAEKQVNRRRFLGAAAGGAIVAGMGGLAIWQWNMSHIDDLEAEVERLQQIIALYEELDATDLDGAVEQGLAAVGTLVESTHSLTAGLEDALAGARTTLLDFQAQFAPLQASFRWLRESLNVLSQRILGLENEVSQSLELPGPITETMGGFLAATLAELPEEVTERLRGGLERMGEVVTAVPALVQGLYARIVEPLEDWFITSADASLDNRLITPLLSTLIDPVQALLTKVDELVTGWQERLVTPLEAKIRRRQEIRQQLDEPA
ncbi:MAG: hypothetical protein JW900_15695 [Anaerolineae bacterium]|nr:hypothetical protein [Anaerolineae bacterium]